MDFPFPFTEHMFGQEQKYIVLFYQKKIIHGKKLSKNEAYTPCTRLSIFFMRIKYPKIQLSFTSQSTLFHTKYIEATKLGKSPRKMFLFFIAKL